MPTILLIDDDALFRAEAGEMLADAGYRVLEAPDGIHGRQLLDQLRENIDLAIIDLLLPGVNGFELIGALARRPNSVRIIATSAVFAEGQLETTVALGAHAVLRKPPTMNTVSRQRWLKTIAQVLSQN